MSAWLLLLVYVLVDVLDVVIVLFQSGGKIHIGLKWLGGGCCSYLQNVCVLVTRRDLNLEPRVYGFHLLTGFRMQTYMWFSVRTSFENFVSAWFFLHM